MMMRTLAGVRTALALALLWMSLSAVYPVSADGGLPSTSATDGRFIGLAGEGLQTLSLPLKFWIAVPSLDTSFKLEVLDGDLGGLWDNHDPLNSIHSQYLLYADPLKSGNPSGAPLVASVTSAGLADNAWSTLYHGPVHPAARSPRGSYFYLLVVQWSDAAQSGKEFNSVKLRGGSQVTITPGQWAFVGGPVNVGVDPPLGSPENTYNGQWNWYAYSPPELTSASFTECDADSRNHTTAPGDPPDDNDLELRLRISPDVTYAVYNSSGQLVLNNLVPSGNMLCETKAISVSAGGLFRWTWSGVDAHNLIFIRSDYEIVSVAETPVPVGPTFTPTPSPVATATASATSTATPTATAIPSVTPTLTPVPPASTAVPDPPEPPAPAASSTPYPTPTQPSPVSTVLVSCDEDCDPTPTPIVPAPKLLPKAGDNEPDPSPIIGAAFAMLVLGIGLKLWTRRRDNQPVT